eukprot:NODE_35_length_31537_cov_0.293403.p22 type:complete len:109 gc:universal NODE_35_length_31537_cov_0.293403:27200-26874(-)
MPPPSVYPFPLNELVPLCLSHKFLNPLGDAPVSSSIATEFSITLKVGIAVTPYFFEISGDLSTSTLTNFKEVNSFDKASKVGAIALHGPHQVAVKSTISLPLCLSIVL